MCDFSDIIPDKDKKGRIMVKKRFVLHEEVIDVFNEHLYSQNRKTFISY